MDNECDICGAKEHDNDEELYSCDYCGASVCGDCMEDEGAKIYCSPSCENSDQS